MTTLDQATCASSGSRRGKISPASSRVTLIRKCSWTGQKEMRRKRDAVHKEEEKDKKKKKEEEKKKQEDDMEVVQQATPTPAPALRYARTSSRAWRWAASLMGTRVLLRSTGWPSTTSDSAV